MYKTLIQTLLAGFYAILAASPLEGGGVMIAARQIAFGASAKKYTAADYIQDSASWMLDGIENSRFGEHNAVSGVNAVWNNLVDDGATNFRWAFSGGLNFYSDYVMSLEHNGVYGGYKPSIATVAPGWGELCFTVFCEFIEIVFSLPDVTPVTDVFFGGYNQNGVRVGSGFIATGNGVGYPIENDEIVSLAFSTNISNSKTIYYKNGVNNPVSQSFVDKLTGGINNYTLLGGGYKETYPVKYHRVYFHNRILAAEEVAHNYEIDKARFNI